MCNVYTPHWSTVNFVSENGRPRFYAPTPTEENTPMFGELIQSASLSVTFALVVSRLAQLAWRTLKPPHRTRTRVDMQSKPAQDAPAARPYLSYRRAKAASGPMN